MIKVAAIGVCAAVLAVWIKPVKPEYGLWILLGGGILLGLFSVDKLKLVVEELGVLQSFFASYAGYFKLLLKIIGITYLAEFAVGLCKDAGANSIASQIELFGKLSILVLCMPILSALLETLDQFLGG